MGEICEKYERLTRMHVYERQPYAGELVFTAFRDRIKMQLRKEWHIEKKRARPLDSSISSD